MQRVAVIGSGGAGKSTFAARLGERTGLPVVHLDREFWRPGWVETPAGEWRRRQEELASGGAWIMDGNYGATLDVRLSRADTVVFFDLPRLVCLRRAVWRALRHRGRAVQAAGCPERLDPQFLRWVWRYPTRSRPRVVDALERYAGGARLHVVRRRGDTERVLDELSRPCRYAPS